MNQVEVCFSPLLFEEFAKPNSIVVVVDVFRATSDIMVPNRLSQSQQLKKLANLESKVFLLVANGMVKWLKVSSLGTVRFRT
jgi:hypothetical protein